MRKNLAGLKKSATGGSTVECENHISISPVTLVEQFFCVMIKRWSVKVLQDQQSILLFDKVELREKFKSAIQVRCRNIPAKLLAHRLYVLVCDLDIFVRVCVF